MLLLLLTTSKTQQQQQESMELMSATLFHALSLLLSIAAADHFRVVVFEKCPVVDVVVVVVAVVVVGVVVILTMITTTTTKTTEQYCRWTYLNKIQFIAVCIFCAMWFKFVHPDSFWDIFCCLFLVVLPIFPSVLSLHVWIHLIIII